MRQKAGWNPSRRNRNIGTAKQGHGSENTFIPSVLSGKGLYRSYTPRSRQQFFINGKNIDVLTEALQEGFLHPCSVADIVRVLCNIPPNDIALIDFVLLHQPTRKAHLLAPFWGASCFHSQLPFAQGTGILLSAQTTQPGRWPKKLSPFDRLELDRLINDGHRIHFHSNRIEIETSPDSLRNTLLYRTLLHEIGHIVDHHHRSAQWATLDWQEKEHFAHRYAKEKFEKLKREKGYPFSRLPDSEPDSISHTASQNPS